MVSVGRFHGRLWRAARIVDGSPNAQRTDTKNEELNARRKDMVTNKIYELGVWWMTAEERGRRGNDIESRTERGVLGKTIYRKIDSNGI